MAIDSIDTMLWVGKKTKSIDRDLRLRFGRALYQWVEQKHDGNQTAAGKELGISQGHVSALINGERGVGLNVLLSMRDKTGRSLDDLLGLPSPGDELAARFQASLDLEVARFRAEATKTLEQAKVKMAEVREKTAPTKPKKETG